MSDAEKACAFVLREAGGGLEVLAFDHPLAGRQFVKGTIERGETPHAAALRELREESGVLLGAMDGLGTVRIDGQVWHLFAAMVEGQPDGWTHQTEDDEGHAFSFFWHPLGRPLDGHWHASYRLVIGQLRSSYLD
jgi:8-oxo-dGTP pyrophosphatase MutT (NUDIX family)